MITNGEFVSRVVNDINALSKDVHVSKRWILSIGRTKAESYVVQRWDDGSMIEDGNLLTCVDCVRMIEVDKIDCCDAIFSLCGFLMRSEHRLPGIVFSTFGPLITKVSNVDNTIFYKYSNLEAYRNRVKRRYADKGPKYFYIHDGYLYIPDEHIELVNVCYFTMKRREALRISACKPGDECISEWDYDFIYPVKLIEYIVQETVKEVMNKVQIPTDENPNMDSNQKSQIVQ